MLGIYLQAFSIMFFAWISDKYRQRAALIAVQALMTLVGLLMTGFLHSPGGRYAGRYKAPFLTAH